MMMKPEKLLATLALFIPVAVSFPALTATSQRHIALAALEDKIRGGWAGQMIGVSYGAPTEFRARGEIYSAEIKWSPEKISNSINQDDLYVEMTFAEVMDGKGLNATTEEYGEMFKDSKYNLWHANAAARRLLNYGIKAPMSGHPRYNPHANDIDFQIESDFIGLMTPGLPQESNKYADRIGRVMNYGDGVYGGMFFGGMYSSAFFETDVRRVVEQGLACIPARSRYGLIIRDVLDWSSKYPESWQKTWQLIEDKWDKDDPCPNGALESFNIDASINGAYVALGLLYGKGDFARTLEVSTRAGQDSDCNPSSAAGILGVMHGYEKIPDMWKSGIPKIADTKFRYTSYSFNEICTSTLERAKKVIRMAGGRIEGEAITIPFQAPKAPKLEQWDPGVPDKRIGITDGAWSWKGTWVEEKDRRGQANRVAEGAGAEASLSFSGAAVMLLGPCSQSGGRADVYLDGRKVGELNAYIPAGTNDSGLWHTYNVAQGSHVLRVVTRDDADPRSEGKRIVLIEAVTFKAR